MDSSGVVTHRHDGQPGIFLISELQVDLDCRWRRAEGRFEMLPGWRHGLPPTA